jgi:hypothetical protein
MKTDAVDRMFMVALSGLETGRVVQVVGCLRRLTFELRRPARRAALAPRRTMELATALRGARVARLVGSPLERGVRRHAGAR